MGVGASGRSAAVSSAPCPPSPALTVLGAAVCVELWSPRLWLEYLAGRMPKFRRLFDQLSG